jgi:glutamine synthetase
VLYRADDGRPGWCAEQDSSWRPCRQESLRFAAGRRCKIPTVCSSLDQALEYLDKDREFLTRGGVFSNEMIDAYIALKMEEVQRFRMTTHPIEYDMYYSI